MLSRPSIFPLYLISEFINVLIYYFHGAMFIIVIQPLEAGLVMVYVVVLECSSCIVDDYSFFSFYFARLSCNFLIIISKVGGAKPSIFNLILISHLFFNWFICCCFSGQYFKWYVSHFSGSWFCYICCVFWTFNCLVKFCYSLVFLFNFTWSLEKIDISKWLVCYVVLLM